MGMKNIRPASVSTRAGWVRTWVVAILIALIWFLTGWMLSSLALGAILSAVSLVLGPLCIPGCYFIIGKMLNVGRFGSLRRFQWEEDAFLTRLYFEKILECRGIKLKVWVLPSADISSFWYENMSVQGLSSQQQLVLTTAWLAQSNALKKKYFDEIWQEMTLLNRNQRRLRSVQMSLWLGAMVPLQVLVSLLGIIFEPIAPDLPAPSYWLQGFCRKLYRFWFEPGKQKLPSESLVMGTQTKPLEIPQNWELPESLDSLLWGIWFRSRSEQIHPLWKILTNE